MERAKNRDNDAFPLGMVLRGRPDAAARLSGSQDYPGIRGEVQFYQTRRGLLVRAEFWGLPRAEAPCKERIFGFHIHEGGSCAGDWANPFAGAGGHYNPRGCPHPSHAGDLPPLFGNDGRALAVFLTDRFTVREILGKTLIVHDRPDDFTSQPAGNAGTRIACGVIEPTGRGF